MLVFAAEGTPEMMDVIGAWLSENATIHLYRVERAPLLLDLASAFEECQFPGYEAKALDSWNAALSDPQGNTRLIHNSLVWTATDSSDEVVWGYYITLSSGRLLFAEAAPAPVPMGVSGFTHVLYPQLAIPFPLE